MKVQALKILCFNSGRYSCAGELDGHSTANLTEIRWIWRYPLTRRCSQEDSAGQTGLTEAVGGQVKDTCPTGCPTAPVLKLSRTDQKW